MTASTAERVLDALQPYALRGRNNRYRCNSPLRPGSDSQSFRLLIADGEHGAWTDSVSGESGSLYELARRLGIEPPQESADHSSKRRYDGLDDYATSHGATREQFEAAGWREVIYLDRPALAFDTEHGVRYRFLDGEKPVYINETGYQPCWYGLRRAVDMAQRRNSPIVLCNGEASVVAAHTHGVPAAAVTSGGEKPIPEHLVATLRNLWSGPIVVAFDCDDAGRRGATQAVAQLRALGYEARAIHLGGSAGYDLADFCRLYRDESYPVLLELYSASKPRSKVIHASKLRQLPPPEWLVRDWIVARGLNVIYGAPGTGKSTRVLDWACDLADTHRVLYVAAEDASGYAPRHDGWCRHHGRDTPGLLFWPEAVNALDPASVEEFVSEIRALQVDLVIFDTLARCMPGGNDSDAIAMGLFIAMCDRVRHECGAAALAVHHTGKNGEYRGHSSLLGAADMFIRFEDKDDLKITTVEKAKNSLPTQPLRERFVVIETDIIDPETQQPVTTVVLTPAAQVDDLRSQRLTTNQMRVMETLCLRIFEGRGVSALQLAEATNLAKSSLYHTLSILRKRGYVEYVSGRSSNLQPTPDGRQAFLAQYQESPDRRAEQPRAFRAVPGYDSHVAEMIDTHIGSPMSNSASGRHSPMSPIQSNDNSNSQSNSNDSNPTLRAPQRGAGVVGPLDYRIGMQKNELDSDDESNGEHWTPTAMSNQSRADLAPGVQSSPMSPTESNPVQLSPMDSNAQDATPVRNVDWTYVLRLYQLGELERIQMHCVLRRADYATVLARAQAEAGDDRRSA